MRLRRFAASDACAVTDLFYASVHETCAGEYTPSQLSAWAPDDIDPVAWALPLLDSYTLLAEENGAVLGFGNTYLNYIDRLYVHPLYQGRGEGKTILFALEEKCKGEVTVYASDTAKPFFQRMGYHVIRENRVVRFSVTLHNWYMAKSL